MRYIRALRVACNPTANRKEYLSKLFTLLNDPKYYVTDKDKRSLPKQKITNDVLTEIEMRTFEKFIFQEFPHWSHNQDSFETKFTYLDNLVKLFEQLVKDIIFKDIFTPDYIIKIFKKIYKNIKLNIPGSAEYLKNSIAETLSEYPNDQIEKIFN